MSILIWPEGSLWCKTCVKTVMYMGHLDIRLLKYHGWKCTNELVYKTQFKEIHKIVPLPEHLPPPYAIMLSSLIEPPFYLVYVRSGGVKMMKMGFSIWIKWLNINVTLLVQNTNLIFDIGEPYLANLGPKGVYETSRKLHKLRIFLKISIY